MMLQWWNHSLFWWGSPYMHLVNWLQKKLLWAEMPKQMLCSSPPFYEGKNCSLQVHTLTLSLRYLDMCSHIKSARVDLFKKKHKIEKEYYIYRKVSKHSTWICTKIKHWILIYTTSLGSWEKSMLVSQQCKSHFWEIVHKLVDGMNCWFSRISQKLSYFKVLLYPKFYSILGVRYSPH